MVTQFPEPVLSVAADVVQELQGEDALYGLWALFTKCKESLKDGRRLENISWRLWYRDVVSQHSPTASPRSLSPPFNEKRSPTPITPTSEDGQNNAALQPQIPDGGIDLQTAHSWHGDVSQGLRAPTAGRRLSIASAPLHPVHSAGVGKVIIDILPKHLDLPASKINVATKQHPPPTPTSPSMPSSIPTIVQPRPVVAVQSTATPPAPAPRVVVVNPTPHPTPPATPSILRAPAVYSAQPAPAQLAPPLPLTRSTATPSAAVSPAKAPVVVRPPVPSVVPSRDAPVPARLTERGGDETLKPSDRRFFLQEAAESPEHDSLDSLSQRTDAKSDIHVHSPSSAASSQLKSEGGCSTGQGVAARKGAPKMQVRKSKEGTRHAPARAAAALHRTQTHTHLPRQAAQRKTPTTDSRKTNFKIGSASSNGSRGGAPGPSQALEKETLVPKQIAPKHAALKQAVVKQPSGSKSTPPQRSGAAQGSRKPGIVVSSSSEYETETDDDSDWASEHSAEGRDQQLREQKLREAAEEAQRQRDMFAKVPKRSYSNLNRTKSGLLSQLLNPDPSMFPPNHPYAMRGFSSQDMTQYRRQGGARPALPTSKSSVAVPLAAQVVAQAPLTNGAPEQTRAGDVRPKKGRPQSAEMEMSDSEGDHTDNVLEVSRSLAQQKLAALADRRHSDRGPPPPEPAARPIIPSVATAPIPLGHPYNLPAPAPPMTPRTTRRQMLSTELSESLRRNLLWERQVSRNNLTGPRRGGVLGNGLRPLTAMTTEQQRDGDSSSKSGHEGESKQRNPARNRSWADDYHYAGW